MKWDIPVLRGPEKDLQPTTVEVCRSFSYKLNLANHGGPPYESVDFFASRKMTCRREDEGWVSAELLEQCVAEVKQACQGVISELKRKKAAAGAQRDRRGLIDTQEGAA